MSEYEARDQIAGLLSRLTDCVTELLAIDPAQASIGSLRQLNHVVESQLARLALTQIAAFAELDGRNLVGELGLRGLPQFIEAELRCSRRTAKAKSQAVGRFGRRIALTGQLLSPRFQATAEALADGSVSVEHANVIADQVETLPRSTRAERGDEVEATLVELARSKSPATVRLLGQRIIAHLDPDGPQPAEVDRVQRGRRGLSLLDPGSPFGPELSATLTGPCHAIWQAILTPLAEQRPADLLGEDSRSTAERMHDAFERAGRLLLESGKLPKQAGLASTLVVTIELRDLERRIGRATTHHGGTLSVPEALRLAAEGQLIPAVLCDGGGVLNYGRRRRLASQGQRLALFSRDRGCTFPDCRQPAARSEIHHVTDWARGGRTDLGQLAIACGYHNNEAPRQGWRTVMRDGVPHWVPPPWRDPDQRPVRNYYHHPELLCPPPPEPEPEPATTPATTPAPSQHPERLGGW